ncbi:MAG: 50S ribosomal protein L18 [Nitrososphaeria archaeon]
MKKVRYIEIFRRRREGKTDYHLRKKIVVSRLPFVSIRVSNKNILLQVIKASTKGDTVVESVHSRQLQKFDWPFSRKSIPASYLCGLILGLRAKDKTNSRVIVYMGVEPYVSGSRAAAAIKGIVDSGLKIEANAKTFPDDHKIKGGHIIEYAKNLKSSDSDLYNKRFSNYIREGLDIEELSNIVEKVKKTIIEKKGVVE